MLMLSFTQHLRRTPTARLLYTVNNLTTVTTTSLDRYDYNINPLDTPLPVILLMSLFFSQVITRMEQSVSTTMLPLDLRLVLRMSLMAMLTNQMPKSLDS